MTTVEATLVRSGRPRSISIIVVSWNTAELLAACLASIEHTVRQAGGWAVQVIVVDNGSTDGTGAMLERGFPWVVTIRNSANLGFARANNQGLARSVGDAVLFLNSDAILQDGAVAILYASLMDHPDAGAVGPQIVNPDGSPQRSHGRLPGVAREIVGAYRIDDLEAWFARRADRRGGLDRPAAACRRVERVSFACTLLRRAAIEAIGPLDERFEFYSEDYDYFKRLKDGGWAALFCPSARVYHRWGASSAQRPEWAMRQLYRGKRLYFAKHASPAAESLVRLAFLVRFGGKRTVARLRALTGNRQGEVDARLYGHLIADMARGIERP